MTPESTAVLVARWTRAYTRNLPSSVADRRREEIVADIDDHIASARAQGIRDGRIARSIASRTLRGLLADAAWRRHQIAVLGSVGRRTGTSLIRSAIGDPHRPRRCRGLGDSLDRHGVSQRVAWSPADFLFAGVLLTIVGVAVELAVRRAGRPSTSVGIAAAGVGAGIVGQADDAPGLVVLGLLLIVSAGAMAVRTTRRSR
jgi:hypothetical protein